MSQEAQAVEVYPELEIWVCSYKFFVSQSAITAKRRMGEKTREKRTSRLCLGCIAPRA